MGRVLPVATETDRVIACNLCGGLEHRPVFREPGREFLRCRGCGLVFTDGAAWLHQGFDRASLDQSVPALCEMRPVVRQHLGMLRRAVGRSIGLRLLVIGRANQRFLSKTLRLGFEAEGHAENWREAAYADACFDVVTLFDGLGKVRDPLGELTAMRRLLRPGGWLLLSAPNVDGLLPRLAHGLAPRYRPQSPSSEHLYRFSGRTLAELTERAGYEVTDICPGRLPVGRSSARFRSWIDTPLSVAFAALFAPAALIGPWLGMGDWICLSARRPV